MPETPRMTHRAWLDEAVKRFGRNPRNWRFRCPLCRNEASVQDFEDVKRDTGERAPVECIGRVWNEVGRGPVGGLDAPRGIQPCNWAAFGLFGTLDGGVQIEREDGKVTNAFEFADPAPVPEAAAT